MEKQLNCALLLPLQDMALRKLVIMAWNQVLAESEVSDSYLYYMAPCDSRSFRQQLRSSIEKGVPLVKDKLSQLVLPKSLLKKATSVIEPIGSEIKHWIHLHGHFLYPKGCCEKIFDRTIFSKLYWTSVGTINYLKTAEELIRSEMLDAFVLYKFACFYCLEDYIPLLLEKIPNFTEGYSSERNSLQIGQAHLDNFWDCVLKERDFVIGRKIQNCTNMYGCFFKKSAYIGNKAAAEYFYQKLTIKARKILLLKTAEGVAVKKKHALYRPNILQEQLLSDVLFHLLSKMTPEQQMDLLKRRPYYMLTSYLQWPWQVFFLDVAELAWEFLPVEDYCNILIYFRGMESNLGNLRVDLFRNFFLSTPSDLKNSFIDQQCRGGYVLLDYFDAEDSESVKFVFRNINAASKLRLAFSNQGCLICRSLLRKGQLHLLKLFIREAMLSREDRLLLKEDWASFLSESYEYYGQILNWKQFSQLWDECDGNASCKRSLEDETVTKFRKT